MAGEYISYSCDSYAMQKLPISANKRYNEIFVHSTYLANVPRFPYLLEKSLATLKSPVIQSDKSTRG